MRLYFKLLIETAITKLQFTQVEIRITKIYSTLRSEFDLINCSHNSF